MTTDTFLNAVSCRFDCEVAGLDIPERQGKRAFIRAFIVQLEKASPEIRDYVECRG